MKKDIQTPTITVSGYTISSATPQEALAGIFECTPNIDCWSYPALKDLYIGSIKIVCEWCEEMKKILSRKTKFTKFINQAERMILYTPRKREDLIKRMYEVILVRDNLGPLRGFGISNTFGDNIKGNPETQALRYTHNLL